MFKEKKNALKYYPENKLQVEQAENSNIKNNQNKGFQP